MVWEYIFTMFECHVEEPKSMQRQYTVELKQLVQMQKMWALRKPILDAHILSLLRKIQELEQGKIRL